MKRLQLPSLLRAKNSVQPGRCLDDKTFMMLGPRLPKNFHVKIYLVNTLRLTQNGYSFAGSIFKCILWNENDRIPNPIQISMKFIAYVLIDNKPALVQIMAWRRPGDKLLSEPMMDSITDAYMHHMTSMI